MLRPDRDGRRATDAMLRGASLNDNRRPVLPSTDEQSILLEHAARAQKQAADDPNFVSTVDLDPTLIRPGRKHGPGLIILGR
ncbi:hypothetical protein NLG97_g3497 [Lecanicillium saksenae]|uniref:Uncharacterized protein n=1 Tax=Lecanicillium saksenae TaxID=468837 RepID=A0ACC1R1X9_9HYPO|nr:hypothetical protein NLG97_g3497 [Lecanicillium saksenae]